jgi:hypothetical protein
VLRDVDWNTEAIEAALRALPERARHRVRQGRPTDPGRRHRVVGQPAAVRVARTARPDAVARAHRRGAPRTAKAARGEAESRAGRVARAAVGPGALRAGVVDRPGAYPPHPHASRPADGRSTRGPPGRPRPPFGGGVIGNTTGSGPVIEGSSPSPRAGRTAVTPRFDPEPTSVSLRPARPSCGRASVAPPSSSGLGRRPLKAVTAVQIRSGVRFPQVIHREVRSRRGRPSSSEPAAVALRLGEPLGRVAREDPSAKATCPGRAAGRVRGRPQLEVLHPVVGAVAVEWWTTSSRRGAVRATRAMTSRCSKACGLTADQPPLLDSYRDFQ